MPSKLQQVPRGLLTWLGSLGTGIYPAEMPDSVQPIVDLSPYYDSGRHENVSVVGAATATGDNQVIVVPSGEIWRVVAMASRHAAGGAGVIGGHFIGMRTVPNGITCPLGFSPESPIAAVANELTVAVAQLGRPIMLGPGAEIVGQLTSNSVAASQLAVVATIVRLTA